MLARARPLFSQPSVSWPCVKISAATRRLLLHRGFPTDPAVAKPAKPISHSASVGMRMQTRTQTCRAYRHASKRRQSKIQCHASGGAADMSLAHLTDRSHTTHKRQTLFQTQSLLSNNAVWSKARLRHCSQHSPKCKQGPGDLPYIGKARE